MSCAPVAVHVAQGIAAMIFPYTQASVLYASAFSQTPDAVTLPGGRIGVRNTWLRSARVNVLPGARAYVCATHGLAFKKDEDDTAADAGPEMLAHPDPTIAENAVFRVSTFARRPPARATRAILLLHGLNEREWAKYLPWAVGLVERTGAAVILLPIAFHMNRAPAAWRQPKAMRPLTLARQARCPALTASSVANAAISARLHARPERFFWSGMQTYDDILQLVRSIRGAQLPDVAPTARIDCFGYSMGAFLALILLMTNEDGLFDASRLFAFCGGATFDRTYATSKHILDSAALIALYAFFVEQLDGECLRDPRLAHYFEVHPGGRYFRALLANRTLKDVREARLRELGGRIAALALEQDVVLPPSEVIATLQGDARTIPISVAVRDFPYPYTHESPFPRVTRYAPEIDRAFDEMLERAAAHFGANEP